MAKKKKHPEHANHERWLVSYADFITLLFAFFTTLYAISIVDAQKVAKMASSMQSAFGSMTFPEGSSRLSINTTGGLPVNGKISIMDPINPKESAIGGGGPQARRKVALPTLKSQVEATAILNHFSDKVQVLLDARGLIIRLSEVGFYDSGVASLKPGALSIIDFLAGQLGNLDNDIRVEGHTDNVPIKTSQYPSNWELSTARATTLVEYLLTKHKFDPNRVSASGCGEYRPVAANDTPENRALNRHVDIIVMNENAMRQEPRTATR